MQGGKAAHRKTDDVRLVDLERIEHRADIVARPILRIFFAVLRHVGGRIAARVDGDAAIVARKVTHLLLPGTIVSRKLMDEDDRDPSSGLLVVKLHAIVGCQMRHVMSSRIQNADARAESPASMVTTEPLV